MTISLAVVSDQKLLKEMVIINGIVNNIWRTYCCITFSIAGSDHYKESKRVKKQEISNY